MQKGEKLRREIYRGNSSAWFFPNLKEKSLKRKKEKGDRKEWEARVLPDLENKTKMIPFKTNIYNFVSF